MLTSYGITMVFGTSGFTCEIVDVGLSGEEREDIDATHQASPNNYREFEPGDLVDGGEYELKVHFDPDAHPPMTAAKETIRVTWPLPAGQSSAGSTAFPGYIKSRGVAGNLGTKMEQTVVVKVAGKPTHTASS